MKKKWIVKAKNQAACNLSFASDNGPTLAGGYHYNYFDSNSILRGGERDLCEGGIRVPFLVRWPGKIRGWLITLPRSAGKVAGIGAGA